MKSARTRRASIAVLALALVTWSGGHPAAAQAVKGPVAAMAVQGLAFGPILPGVEEAIAVSDAWRRAEIRVEGGGTLELRFVLPTALVSRSGARIPLNFGAADGLFVAEGSGKSTPFNPTAPFPAQIPPGKGMATVYLGATARPAANQPAGIYSATLVLTVSSPTN